jgi:hypothetical protein
MQRRCNRHLTYIQSRKICNNRKKMYHSIIYKICSTKSWILYLYDVFVKSKICIGQQPPFSRILYLNDVPVKSKILIGQQPPFSRILYLYDVPVKSKILIGQQPPFSRILYFNSIIMSGIAPKQTSFKFKIASHKQTSVVNHFMAGRWAPPDQRGPVLKQT